MVRKVVLELVYEVIDERTKEIIHQTAQLRQWVKKQGTVVIQMLSEALRK